MVSYRERINQKPIERSIMLNKKVDDLNKSWLRSAKEVEVCPECEGTNLFFREDQPVKCFDCDASDYQ